MSTTETTPAPSLAFVTPSPAPTPSVPDHDYEAECAVRFLEAAGRGRTLKGSGGEVRAYCLLVAIVNHSCGLDSELITGALKFAQFTNSNWPAAAEMAEKFAGKIPKQRHPSAR